MSSLITRVADANFAGKFEEAVSLAQTASEENDPLLSIHHAAALNQLGWWNKTLAVVQKALNAGLKDVELLANLNAERVFALYSSGQHLKAAQIAQEVLELPFNNPWVRGDLSVSLAIIHNQKGDHEAAKKVVEEARSLKFSDKTLKARLLLEEGTALNGLEEPEKAAEVLQEARALATGNLSLIALLDIELGKALKPQGEYVKTLISKGQYLEAIQAAQEVLELPFNNPWLRGDLSASLAGAYNHMENHKDAKKVVEKARALEFSDKTLEARLLLEEGIALNGLGKHGTAVEVLRKALTSKNLAPNLEALLYAELRNALHSQGKYEEAAEALGKALVLTPLTPDLVVPLYIEIGTALNSQGKYEKAAAVLEKALTLTPLSPNVMTRLYVELGSALNSQGKYGEAEAVLRKGLALKSLAPGLMALLYIELGSALNFQGKYGETVGLIEECIESKEMQNLPNQRAHLLLLKAKTLDDLRAIKVLKEISKIPGQNEETQAIIAIEMAKTYIRLKNYEKVKEVTKKLLESKSLKNETLKAALALQRSKALNKLNSAPEPSQKEAEDVSRLCLNALGFSTIKNELLLAEVRLEYAKALNCLSEYKKAYDVADIALNFQSLKEGDVKAELMLEQVISLNCRKLHSQAAELTEKALAFSQLKDKELIKALKENLAFALENKEEQKFEQLQNEELAKYPYDSLRTVDLFLTKTQKLLCHKTRELVRMPVEYQGNVYEYKNFINLFKNNDSDEKSQLFDLSFLRRVIIHKIPSYGQLQTREVYTLSKNPIYTCEISRTRIESLVTYKGCYFDYNSCSHFLQMQGQLPGHAKIDLKCLYRVVFKEVPISDYKYDNLKIKYIFTGSERFKNSTCTCGILEKITEQPVMYGDDDRYFDYGAFMETLSQGKAIPGIANIDLNLLCKVVLKGHESSN